MATTFIIPDWPATTKWLSEEEKALGVVRLIEDAGEEESEIRTFDSLKMAAQDHRVWLCVLNQMCLQAVASLTNFLPTLVKDFGYSNINTLLLTAPVSPEFTLHLVCTSCTDSCKSKAVRVYGPIQPVQHVAQRQNQQTLPLHCVSDASRHVRHHNNACDDKYRRSILRIVPHASRDLWGFPNIQRLGGEHRRTAPEEASNQSCHKQLDWEFGPGLDSIFVSG